MLVTFKQIMRWRVGEVPLRYVGRQPSAAESFHAL